MLNAAGICNKTPQWGTAIVGHFVKKSIQLSVNERVLDDTDGTVCAVYIYPDVTSYRKHAFSLSFSKKNCPSKYGLDNPRA